MAPQSRSSSPTFKQRKSWFSFHRRAHNRVRTEPDQPPPSAFELHQQYNNLPASAEESDQRVGPLQFAPNRIATLYVTPSERNLYLAAMAQLDQGPQPLHLWADPPPRLPRLPTNSVMDTEPPRVASTLIHPLTTTPLSPKLVTSPNLPESGLQIREEFRSTQAPRKYTRHALLSLVPNSFVRLTGFAPETVAAVNQAMGEAWPGGVWLRSEEMDAVIQKPGNEENYTWKAELHGRAWKRKGSQELNSIRLLLAILTVLGTHGWTVETTIQAAGMQKLSHNLVFRYSSETYTTPPAFFALSLPLPDRISLIHTPSKITPSVLTAVRTAISSCSHLAGHGRAGTEASTATASSKGNERLTRAKDGQAKGIKLEGWVHPGVYRFWIGGLRRLGGRISQVKVDNLHPGLILTVMNNLSTIHFGLAASIPLFPPSKGRDVLFFASRSDSGLSHLDTFTSNPSAGNTSMSESPVFVSPAASLGSAATAPNGGPATGTAVLAPPPPVMYQQIASDQSDVPEGHRVLPWSSILDDEVPPPERSASRAQVVNVSFDSNAASPPSAMPDRRQRTTSQDSSRPVIPTSAQPSPRPRNVLLKKNSLRRQRSVSGGGSIDLPPPAPGAPTVEASVITTDTTEHDGQWSMVDIPASVGHLGVSAYQPLSHMPQAHGTPQQANSVRSPPAVQPSVPTSDSTQGPSSIPQVQPPLTIPSTPAAARPVPPSPVVPTGSGAFMTIISPARHQEPPLNPSRDESEDASTYEVPPEDTPPLLVPAHQFVPSRPDTSRLSLTSTAVPGLTAATFPPAASGHDAMKVSSNRQGSGLSPHPHDPETHELLPPPLALGQPVSPTVNSSEPRPASHEYAPLRGPDASPKRAGNAMVDVGSGIGVPSMHGSFGFFPRGQSVISNAQSEVSLPPPVPPPRAGSSRTRMTIE